MTRTSALALLLALPLTGWPQNRPADMPALTEGAAARLHWSGSVSGELVLDVQDKDVRVRSGRAQNDRSTFSSPLPRTGVTVRIANVRGAADVQVAQQPSQDNTYTAEVRIRPKGNSPANVSFDLVWVEEARK